MRTDSLLRMDHGKEEHDQSEDHKAPWPVHRMNRVTRGEAFALGKRTHAVAIDLT
jgi:hypothetical protein